LAGAAGCCPILGAEWVRRGSVRRPQTRWRTQLWYWLSGNRVPSPTDPLSSSNWTPPPSGLRDITHRLPLNTFEHGTIRADRFAAEPDVFPVPAVAHKYPDSPDCADGRTLIIGGATNRKMRAHSRRSGASRASRQRRPCCNRTFVLRDRDIEFRQTGNCPHRPIGTDYGGGWLACKGQGERPPGDRLARLHGLCSRLV